MVRVNKKCIKCNRIGKFELDESGKYLLDRCPKCDMIMKSVRASDEEIKEYSREINPGDIPFNGEERPEGDDE